MPNNQEKKGLNNFFLAIIGLGFIAYGLYISQSFTIPLTIAILLGVLLNPMISYLVRIKVPESLAVTMVMLGVFLGIFLITSLFFQAINSVANDLGKYGPRCQAYLDYMNTLSRDYLQFDIEEELFYNGSNSILKILSPERLVVFVNSSIGTFMEFFSDLLTMLLFLFFILLSRSLFIRKVFQFLDAQDVEETEAQQLVRSLAQQVQSYLLLKTLISIGTGLVVWMAALLLGLDFPFVWGLISFLLNYIPSVGPIFATIPPVLIALLQFPDNLAWVGLILVVLIVIQFSSGNIIEPQLMGDRLNLNIVVVLLSLFVWGMIWGFVGMVLSVPLTAIINILLYHFKGSRKISILLSN